MHEFKSFRISMRCRSLEDPRMNHRRFKRLCVALPLLLFAIPDGARSQEFSKEISKKEISKEAPVNAQAKSYGTGW